MTIDQFATTFTSRRPIGASRAPLSPIADTPWVLGGPAQPSSAPACWQGSAVETFHRCSTVTRETAASAAVTLVERQRQLPFHRKPPSRRGAAGDGARHHRQRAPRAGARLAVRANQRGARRAGSAQFRLLKLFRLHTLLYKICKLHAYTHTHYTLHTP